MAYTPELNQKYSCTLRRIAWALDKPMTRAIEDVLDYVGRVVDKNMVCQSCRDNSKCSYCMFHSN